VIDHLRTAGVALLFLVGALGATLLLAATVFGVPVENVPRLASVLSVSGVVAGSCGMLLTRPAVLRRFGGVRGQIVSISLVCSLLILGVALAGAVAMFISLKDLSILLTTLLFASLLMLGLGRRAATPLALRVERVRQGTARLASGELEVEVEVPDDGDDEISGLARDFNRMVARLREGAERERGLEQRRRDLIAAVSHDLRTPLASTLALVEAVADGVASDAETQARYLSSAQRELVNLGRLIDDLFELVQIDAGVLRPNLEPASLHDLISDILASFRPQAEHENVRLIGEVSRDVDPVLMDLPRLGRVLQNLVGNALRYTPTGGTIFLRAEPQGAEPQGEVVRVEVVDTGEGISSEDLPHVFERSFRGEEPQMHQEEEGVPGAGLGLAIAQGLIEAHGGTIEVESSPGEGTRFYFTLRRA
jgi:signal transduction histidine kinase